MEKDILSICCQGCGAPAEFDIVRQHYRCQFCGGTVSLEKARTEKMKYRSAIKLRLESDAARFPLMTASCSGCGAKLIFEENEAVTSCAFCGRKLVRETYARTADMPEAIIPFALTKEEAKERLAAWCRKNRRKRESRHLSAKAGELEGYYLPYEMVRGPVSLCVNKTNETEVFRAGGYLDAEFVNCSKQLDNLLLDAMEPYDLSELREFDYAFVAGQKVKISDITSAQAAERMQEEADSGYRVFMEKIWGTKAISLNTHADPVFEVPVLLPVYYINDGGVCAAVNGQTGKVSVRAEKCSLYLELPWWLRALFLFIAACGAVFGIGWLSFGNLRDTLLITGVLSLFYLFLFCFMFEPGLNNSFELIRYRSIFTSGENTFRRIRGELVPRAEVLKRRMSEPVFSESRNGKDVPVTYTFRSAGRILGMVLPGIAAVFLPVILALFINGFDFEKLTLGGSAVWFFITVPTVPVMLIQLGLKELYSNPLIYEITEDGKKKRFRKDGKTPLRAFADALKTVLMLCLHPIGWIVLACLCVMVYLTAFGF